MLTLIALSALLQEPPTPPAPPHPPEVRSHVLFMGGDGPHGPGRMDADGDGQVTREEFAAPLDAAFARMDRDGDGRLSAEELASGHGGDGEVTIVRGPGGEGRRFEFRRPGGEGAPRIERDGERVMVFTGREGGPGGEREIVIHPRGGEPRVIHLDGPDAPDGPHGSRVEIRRFGGPDGGGHDLDKDGDGKVSEAEFTAPLREAFARMDADRSGFIEDGERGGDGDVRVFTHRIERRDGAE